MPPTTAGSGNLPLYIRFPPTALLKKKNRVKYWTSILNMCEHSVMPPADVFVDNRDMTVIPGHELESVKKYAIFVLNHISEAERCAAENEMKVDENKVKTECADEMATASESDAHASVPGTPRPRASQVSSPINEPATPQTPSGKVTRKEIFTPNGLHFMTDFKPRGRHMTILLELPVKRPIPWRSDVFAGEMEGERVTAVAMASRGDEFDKCQKCQNGSGTFSGCFVVPEYRGGGCANCKWDHQGVKCRHYVKKTGTGGNDGNNGDGDGKPANGKGKDLGKGMGNAKGNDQKQQI